MSGENWENTYYNLLKGYILKQEEMYLVQAGELGNRLVRINFPQESVAEIHQASLQRLASEFPGLTLSEFAQLSSAPLIEMLMAYSLSYCASLDALEQAMTQIKESEGRFRALFESSPAGIWEEDFSEVKHCVDSLSAKGIRDFRSYFKENPESLRECVGKVRVVDVNDATLRLYKAGSKSELLKNLNRVFNEGSFKFFEEELLAFINGQTRFTSEMEGMTLDGETVYHLFSICIAPGYEKNWKKLILSDIDITQQKQAKENEARLQAQLRQSQRMETIGTLTGGIAHDFNNILASILGYTELAQHNVPPGSPTDGYLKQVIKASHRARDLVRHLSLFSRKDEEDHQRPVDIGEVVGDALKLMRASLPSTVELRASIAPDCGTVMADGTQIHQVVMNLCTNAYHALGGSCGVVEVSVQAIRIDEILARIHPDLKVGPYICLEVKDNGYGMGPDILERIFDPFFTTKERGKGTGLGLSVVHGIVQRHNGAIMVDSEVGTGTDFKVYIPQIAAEKELQEAEKKTPQRGSERILFVDDEEMLEQLARQSMEQAGYQVITTTDSKKALEWFRSDPGQYDLVITDQTMPDITGSELARRMLEIRPDLPIILTTGYSETMDATKCEKIGIRKFLMKPITNDLLLQSVREALDGKPL